MKDDATVSLPQRGDESWEQLDAAIRRFEAAWRAGGRAELASFLPPVGSPRRAWILARLIKVQQELLSKAKHPKPLSQYLAEWSELLEAPEVLAELLHLTPGKGDLHLQPGSPLGRYRILGRRAGGGMGTVYVGWDADLQRLVAIKVPRADRLSPEMAIALTHWDARAMAILNHHSNIIKVHDFGRLDDDTPFFVMEYIDGLSLAERLVDRITPAEAVKTLLPVIDALHYAHQQGFVHRDIKPANILLSQDGTPHIADFGLAIPECELEKMGGSEAGTRAYMAPEQHRCEGDLDRRVDIWAVGVVLYQMLTGQPPFTGRTYLELREAVLRCKPKRPRMIDDTIPHELERICLRCLTERKEDRYLTAADLARDLRRWQRPRHRSFMAALLAGGLGLVLLLALLPLRGSRPTDTAPPVKPPIVELSGLINVLIWNSEDRSRQGISLRDARALPLKPADGIRVEARLNRPAYLYLIWIDGQGEASPVYPWPPGDWKARPEKESPVDHVTLPEATDEGWPMKRGPGGMETLILLARETPLPSETRLEELLKGLPRYEPQPGAFKEGRLVAWSSDGKFLYPEFGPVDWTSANRAPDFPHATKIRSLVAQTQQLVLQRLGPHFKLCQTVSFSVEGQK